MRIPWYGLPIVAHAPAHSAAKAKRVPSGDQLAPPISVQEPPHLTTHAPMPSVPIARMPWIHPNTWIGPLCIWIAPTGGSWTGTVLGRSTVTAPPTVTAKMTTATIAAAMREFLW
jgi:hypothetical protein